MPETLLRTPLHAEHVALGGRMVPFAGYDMPVQYAGIIAESKAVRQGAGMFDVSHMARLRFTSHPSALTPQPLLEFLEWVTANDVAELGDMQGQYSLLPNERGGTVDDVIVYRLSAGEYHMVVNAANHEKDVAHLRSQLASYSHPNAQRPTPNAISLTDYSDRTAMIAVQGPKAAAIVASLSENPDELLATEFFGCAGGRFWGQEVFVARSGYTGEDGFEIICSGEFAPKLWKALLSAGVAPCGLGSRDTLRVEAGLPLYGHELTDDLSPIAAGLGWVISKTKRFLGSEHIARARNEGPPRKVHGVRLASKRLITPGMKLYASIQNPKSKIQNSENPKSEIRNPKSDDLRPSTFDLQPSPSGPHSTFNIQHSTSHEIGEVTSGVYSPTLDCGIAFALIDSSIPLDTPCAIDVRGKLEPGTVVNKRFLKRAA